MQWTNCQQQCLAKFFLGRKTEARASSWYKHTHKHKHTDTQPDRKAGPGGGGRGGCAAKECKLFYYCLPLRLLGHKFLPSIKFWCRRERERERERERGKTKNKVVCWPEYKRERGRERERETVRWPQCCPLPSVSVFPPNAIFYSTEKQLSCLLICSSNSIFCTFTVHSAHSTGRIYWLKFKFIKLIHWDKNTDTIIQHLHIPFQSDKLTMTCHSLVFLMLLAGGRCCIVYYTCDAQIWQCYAPAHV